MLDRKTEDYDASVELLEDKKKQSKVLWLMFYSIGFFSILSSVFFITYPSIELLIIGVGSAFLILATWFLMIFYQYEFYLFLIHKNIVKAVNKRGK